MNIQQKSAPGRKAVTPKRTTNAYRGQTPIEFWNAWALEVIANTPPYTPKPMSEKVLLDRLTVARQSTAGVKLYIVAFTWDGPTPGKRARPGDTRKASTYRAARRNEIRAHNKSVKSKRRAAR